MQKNRCPLLLLFIIIVLVFFMAACAGKDVAPAPEENQPIADSVPPPPPPPADYTPAPEESRLPEDWQDFVNEDIYFNKNSAVLLPEAKEILARKAAWLQAHPDVRIVIQGHSDEKGSAEFNLALADHRAGNVKSHLLGHGISTERLVVVSYGSESPASTGRGETDSAKNRRVHFSIDVID